MKRRIYVVYSLLLCVILTSCAIQRNASKPDVTDLHCLYDMTPVSATNPVVASVPDCGIEISAREFRAYVNAMPDTMPVVNGTNRPQLTLDQKRTALENLINEHLLMRDGYRQKADQTPNIVQLLDVTKAMLMREALVAQEIGSKVKTPAKYEQAYQKLLDRIFNQTDIAVSNEAYDKLKASLKLLQSVEASPAQTNFLSDPGLNKLPPAEREAVIDSVQNALRPSILDKLTPEVRDSIFARCKTGFVTVGNVLDYYQKIPKAERPDLETPDGLSKILEDMFEKNLLTEEARRRGLENSPMVIEKLQLNRNMLVRLYVLNQIADAAEAQSKTPDEQARVKKWYQAHLKDRYTYEDENGKEQAISFDQQYERIESDYVDNLREELRAERIQALRQGHKIETDENVLENTVL